jgi:caa(3)-type oxidase subunit IV
VTTTHSADGMPVVSHEEDQHTHGGVHDPNEHHSPEQIKKEMRVYIAVFCGLAVLTGVTVGACYFLKLPVHYAIMVALAIASVKGFLVAGFFMHLLSERKVVYGILGLTVFFFVVLIWGPWHHHVDAFNPDTHNEVTPTVAQPAGEHSGH